MSEKDIKKLIADNRIWFGENGSNVPRIKRFLSEVQQGIVPLTIWKHTEVSHNQEAMQELKTLVGDIVLELADRTFTPKPVRLIKRMLEIATNSDGNDIILDFFAGSGTTAQAVMEQNAIDGGNRRFVLVQLPEKTGNENFPTISHICMERIKRAGDRLKENRENELDFGDRDRQDTGFRFFRLAQSDVRKWNPEIVISSADEYIEKLELTMDPLLDGWTGENIIFETALSMGYSLSIDIARVEIDYAEVFRVSDKEKEQSFLICLDESFSIEKARALNLTRELIFVCRDAALDDTLAANLALQCRLKTI
jgi:adenine-specific DNA-methyltransferase